MRFFETSAQKRYKMYFFKKGATNQDTYFPGTDAPHLPVL